MRQWLIAVALTPLFLTACDRAPDTDEFVAAAAVTGQFEIEASRLAVTKATNQDVKLFAQQMISDHESAAEKLKSAAIESGRMPPSPALDALRVRLIDELKIASGADFDKLYVEQQLKAHEDAVKLFSDYAKAARDDGPIKRLAEETLPVLEAHLSHVRGLKATPMT